MKYDKESGISTSIINKLKDLEKSSIERRIPIIGSEKAKFLLEIIKKEKPKRILELGTANGYSGIILGSESAKLITIDIDKKAQSEAEENFKKFNINYRIINGDGVLEVDKLVEKINEKDVDLEKQNEKNNSKDSFKFNLIFIDFAKKKYIKVLENCLKLLHRNGLLIADNISMDWCSDFKNAVLNDSRLETEIVDIKDGLSVSRLL